MSDRTKGIIVLIVIAVVFFEIFGREPLINKINTPSTKKEVKKYIENSKLETFELKEEWLDRHPYTIKFNSRKISHKWNSRSTYHFYVPEHKKYFYINVHVSW